MKPTVKSSLVVRLMHSINDALDTLLKTPLVKLLRRDDINEIYCNADGYIWYLSYLEGKVKSDIQLTTKEALAIIELIAGQVGKVINEDIPSVSTEIRGYGCRFQGEIPPIVKAPQFNIRKKALKIFTLDEYVENGTLTAKHRDYLIEAIKKRKNILVVGGTGTGKTTFLNAILQGISELTPTHRIISLEDTPELQCKAEDYSAMFTVQETNKATTVKFNMKRLLMDCMRRSPDRIVVGEVRDGCAYTMLKSWNTGHEGGACTVHANSALGGLTRIRSLAQEDEDAAGDLNELIGEAIDVVVSIVHVNLPNGKRGRQVKEIIEVDSYNSHTHEFITSIVPER